MGGRGKRSHAQVAVWLKRLATAAFSFELKLRHAARTGRRRQPGRLLCGVLGHCGPMATRSLDLETRKGRAERRARLLRLEQAQEAQEAASGRALSPPPAWDQRRSRVEAGSPTLRLRKTLEQPQLGLSASGRAEVSALPHFQLIFWTLFVLCLTTVALFELCLHLADPADSHLTWFVGKTARGDTCAV